MLDKPVCTVEQKDQLSRKFIEEIVYAHQQRKSFARQWTSLSNIYLEGHLEKLDCYLYLTTAEDNALLFDAKVIQSREPIFYCKISLNIHLDW